MSKQIKKWQADWRKRMSVLVGIACGFFFVFGYCLQTKGMVPYTDIKMWLALVLLAAVFGGFAYILFGIEFKRDAEGSVSKKNLLLLLIGAFLFIYGVWFIQLWGIYPGYFNYDAPNQWETYAISQVTAHHPVLHTYLVGWAIHLSFKLFGSANQGCFIFILGQMLITDLIFVRVLHYINRKKLHYVLTGISVLYFALFPPVVLNVMSVTKDSLFAAFFVLFVIETLEMLKVLGSLQEKITIGAWLRFVISAFLSAVLRNNATYIILPFLVLLIVLAFLSRRPKVVITCIFTLAALFLYFGPVVKAVTVAGVSDKEFLSVPSQQIMRVYHLHRPELTSADIAMVDRIFDNDAKVLYVPKIADVAKGSIRQQYFENNKKAIIDFWKDLGLRYPAEYMDAFLLGNYGFWYPGATLVLYPDGGEGYFACRTYNPLWPENKIPAIGLFFERFARSGYVCTNPLTMWIFAPATFFLVHFFLLGNLIARKRWEALPVAVMFLVWLTFLLGPVALVRYVAYLYYALPLEFFLFKDCGAKRE